MGGGEPRGLCDKQSRRLAHAPEGGNRPGGDAGQVLAPRLIGEKEAGRRVDDIVECRLVEAGDDTKLWRVLPSYFTPGTPLYTEEGGEILNGPRNLDAAKRLLAESGYSGEPVSCVVAQDQPVLKAMGEVTADLLKRMGMKVDFVATDWGKVGARRAVKTPPGQGGWHMFHTWHTGAGCINPAPNFWVRANGDGAWMGWPKSDAVEAEVAAWFDAKDLEQEKAAVRRLNRAAFEHVVYAPTGLFMIHQAWRSNLAGVVAGPLPSFWGVSKTA